MHTDEHGWREQLVYCLVINRTLRQEANVDSRISGAVRRWLIVLGIFIVPAYIACRPSTITDPDIWWHIRTGEWILQNHAVPRLDPFSVAASPWVAYSWAFDLLANLFFRRWHLAGLLALTIVLTLVVSAALWALVRRTQPDFVKAAALTIAALIAMSPLYAPRPWMFSIALFAVQLKLLLATRDDGNWRRLLWLPPLYAVLANIHVQFVYALMVLGLAALAPSVQAWLPGRTDASADRWRVSARSLWILVAVCAAATLINPYGWEIYRVIAHYASGRVELQYVAEMHPMSFREPSHFAVVGLLLVACYTLGRRRAGDPFLFMLLVVSCALSFRSVRDIWVVVLTSAAIVASALPGGARGDRVFFWQTAAAMLAAAGFVAIAPRQPGMRGPLDRTVAATYPVEAVRVIRERGLEGPLLNYPDWGGFLIEFLPGIPVQIDGRTNVHRADRLERSIATWNAAPGWRSDPEFLRARLVIGSPAFPLCQLLLADPHFTLAYQDEVAYVLTRR